MKARISLILGPALFAIGQLFFNPNNDPIIDVLCVLVWMLVWWLSEVVNLAVTALLPLVLFPLLGVLTLKEVSVNYGHPLVYLFFGGFVLALGIEKWNLHKRIALLIIMKTGVKARQVLLGFMISTAFLSMWISNTATTIMMLPIVMSVLDVAKVKKKVEKRLAFILLVGVAWSANIGGMMTLIGTPPNLVLAGFYKDQFNVDLSFTNWLFIGIPLGFTLLFAAFFLLSRFLPKKPLFEEHNVVENALKALGPMGITEKRVAIVFFFTALAWVLRPLINKIAVFEHLSDTGVALICALTLFVLPAENKERILKWEDTSKLAWGILVLFGGGLALANAINSSGMMTYVEQLLANMEIEHVLLMITVIAFLGIFVTEMVSNLALVAATLPLILTIAKSFHVDFILLAVPLTVGASCAFMLPMATPPNAIVFSSGKIRVEKMARFGLAMNLISMIIIVIGSYFLASFVA